MDEVELPEQNKRTAYPKRVQGPYYHRETNCKVERSGDASSGENRKIESHPRPNRREHRSNADASQLNALSVTNSSTGLRRT